MSWPRPTAQGIAGAALGSFPSDIAIFCLGRYTSLPPWLFLAVGVASLAVLIAWCWWRSAAPAPKAEG